MGFWELLAFLLAHLTLLPPGPLPAPLLVLCHSEAELSHWIYHLEKQMALLGGLQRCHSAPPQVSSRNLQAFPPSRLSGLTLTYFFFLPRVHWGMNSPGHGYGEHPGVNPWAMQSVPQGSSCSICPLRWVGKAMRCNEIGKDTGAGKAGLWVPNPTLSFDPLQEQWDRILVLYPASLAIFSEEPDGLSFKVGLLHIYLS